MKRDLIINACLTGMVPDKRKCPALPVTPDEIIHDALAAHRLGASIVHIHARGTDGSPTWEPTIYREIFSELRRVAPELILCATTSGRLWNEREKRSAVLMLESDTRPDMASLTLGSLNFPNSVSANSIADIEYLLDAMTAQGVRPEFEIFDLGMADYFRTLVARKNLRGPFYANILLGNIGTAAADEANLRYITGRLPEGTVWAGAGIGKHQMPVIENAVRLGGHIRVGLEDNIYADHAKKTPATNASLIETAVSIARASGRSPMSATEAREQLQMHRA